MVPLLRAEGGEKEPQFGLVAPKMAVETSVFFR
jgi:hypothetical protein